MAISVTFANPAIVRDGDNFTVNFSDGSGQEMPPGADGIQQYVAANAPTADQVKAMFIANRLAADPLLDSPELWNGKKMTLDLEQANPANVVKIV